MNPNIVEARLPCQHGRHEEHYVEPEYPTGSCIAGTTVHLLLVDGKPTVTVDVCEECSGVGRADGMLRELVCWKCEGVGWTHKPETIVEQRCRIHDGRKNGLSSLCSQWALSHSLCVFVSVAVTPLQELP